jgi:hypothetical protein
MKKLLSLIFLIGTYLAVNAQNVQVTASVSQNVLEVGERFELQFSVNTEPSNITPPSMSDFRLLYGPTTSNSFSTQIINGKVTQSSSYTYGYVMQAVKPGKYIIGGAEVTVGGKKYKSNSVTLEVVGSGSAKSQSAQPSGQAQSSQSSQSSQEVSASGDLFIRVLLDKKSVYQGEPITATIKFYSKLNVSSLGQVSPTFNGFFQQELAVPQINSLQRENVNGQIYGTAVLRKFILIPQKSGTLTIDPLSIDCNVQQRVQSRSRSVFDDFFGPQVREVQMKAKSLAVSVNVKSLPGNAPASFNGAVGKFTLDAKVDKTSAKTNDAITLKVTLSGSGNIKLLDAPKLDFPTDFDTYDPKVSVNAGAGGLSGSKTFEYLLIPRNPGQFTIGPVEFSYFDIASGQYKTITSKDFALDIAKGADDGSSAVVSGLSKEDVKYIGKDILFIKNTELRLTQSGSYFFGSAVFYLLFIFSFLLFALVVWLRRKAIRENANVALVRNRRADKFASKRLKQAQILLHANDKEKFYEELLKGIWGYLGDKLNIPQSDLSRDKAREMLEARNVDIEIIEKFIALADNCEFARYAPASVGIDMQGDYDKAIDLILKLQSKLK